MNVVKSKGNKPRSNREIRSSEVRLIDAEGNQRGVVSLDEALQAASFAEMDLVEISPNAAPPVCRVLDYGKYLFEIGKKQAAARKRQKQVQIKEVKFRPGTEEGDYQVKLRNIMRFLENGDKVKVTLRFKGREISHSEIGLRLLERVEADLAEHAQVEQSPKQEGRQQMVMVLVQKRI